MTGAPLDAEIVVERSAAFSLHAALTAAAGERIAVMGPSGAGKSTLLGALAGFVRIDRGRIRLGDDEVASADGARPRSVDPARRGTVLLGQDPRLFPHLSALDNVAFGLRAHGVARSVAHGTARSWLARVGLPDAASRRPSELSGGQQQRVALARALAARPRLVLLDEPLTSLDPDTADGIRTLVQSELGCTAVVVTHAAVDALALAHRLVVLEDGRVTQSGPVREVFEAPATAFAASLAGLNRVEGALRDGMWMSGPVRIPGTAIPGAAEDGAASPGVAEGAAVAAVFRPDAVRLGSPEPPAPGAWTARVRRLEPTLAGVRVHTDAPAVAVDLPLDAVAVFGLTAGMEVGLRVPAGAVRILPA